MLDREGRVAMADVTGVQVEDHFDLENGGGGTFLKKSTILLYMLFASIDPKDIKGWGTRVLIPLQRKVQNLKFIY